MKRGFHKRESSVWRGFTVRESGMEKYLTSPDYLASGKPRRPAIGGRFQVTLSMILPMWVARFHQSMRLGGLLERKDRVHHGANAARLQMRPNLPAQAHRDRGFRLVGLRPERRTGHRQALGHHHPQVELDLGPVQGRDMHQATFYRQDLEVPPEIGAGDHVEHDVHPAAAGGVLNFSHEVLLAMIDGAFGAQLQAGAAFRLAAGGSQRELPPARARAGWPSRQSRWCHHE